MEAIHLQPARGTSPPEILLRTDTAVPDPAGHEVLVRVEACGLSGSDYEACMVDGEGRSRFGGPGSEARFGSL